MKRVFSNTSEVCHVWAQRNQSEGRNGSESVFFNGDSIYSYGHHFEMARFIKGKDIVLINPRNYSVSTSKHQNEVSYAIDDDTYERVYVAHFPDYRGRMGKDAIRRNIDYYVAEVTDYAEKHRRARVRDYSSSGMHSIASLRRIIELFKGKKHFLTAERTLLEGTVQEVWEELVGDDSKVMKAKEAARKAYNRKQAATTKRRAKELKERLVKWRAGENVYVHEYQGFALRVKDDEVQTSGGANVPLDRAETLWNFIQKVMASGKVWERNGETFEIGHFSVGYIEPSGRMKVGCHILEFNEMNALATTLGWNN
mgnify:CR=1 FL=1